MYISHMALHRDRLYICFLHLRPPARDKGQLCPQWLFVLTRMSIIQILNTRQNKDDILPEVVMPFVSVIVTFVNLCFYHVMLYTPTSCLKN